MQRIPLYGSNDQVDMIVAYALVDDAEHMSRFKWHLNHEGYAHRHSHGRKILMHREVLGLTALDGHIGDHINRNRIDNRRANLRVVDAAGNAQNKSPKKSSRSGVRGVAWCATHGRWKARVTVAGVVHRAGTFRDLSEAAAAVEALRTRLQPCTSA